MSSTHLPCMQLLVCPALFFVHSHSQTSDLALAAVNTLRSLAGFGFPLFSPAMYAKIGYGKGDTILACLAIAIGCPA